MTIEAPVVVAYIVVVVVRCGLYIPEISGEAQRTHPLSPRPTTNVYIAILRSFCGHRLLG